MVHLGQRYTRYLQQGIPAGFLLVGMLLCASPVWAQQQIAYVDSEEILTQMPEYDAVQQKLERQSQEWRQELQERQDALDEMFREYQARELLYTREERQQRRDEIAQEEDALEQLRMRYFGPDGEYYTRQEQLMRPIQERVLQAIEQVAERDGYDYVFDQSGDFLFMYADSDYDITDDVLAELGVDLTTSSSGG